MRRHRQVAGHQQEELVVGKVEEPFILVEFVAGQAGDLGIGEAAEDEIHLAHAAMPGAEQEFLAAGVQVAGHGVCRFCRSGHDTILGYGRDIAWIAASVSLCATIVAP